MLTCHEKYIITNTGVKCTPLHSQLQTPYQSSIPHLPEHTLVNPHGWLQVTFPNPSLHHPAPPACHLNPDFSILESLSTPLQSTSRRPFSKPSPLRASKPLSRIFDGYTERRKHPRGRPGPHRELLEQSRHRDARVGMYPRDLRCFFARCSSATIVNDEAWRFARG